MVAPVEVLMSCRLTYRIFRPMSGNYWRLQVRKTSQQHSTLTRTPPLLQDSFRANKKPTVGSGAYSQLRSLPLTSTDQQTFSPLHIAWTEVHKSPIPDHSPLLEMEFTILNLAAPTSRATWRLPVHHESSKSTALRQQSLRTSLPPRMQTAGPTLTLPSALLVLTRSQAWRRAVRRQLRCSRAKERISR